MANHLGPRCEITVEQKGEEKCVVTARHFDRPDRSVRIGVTAEVDVTNGALTFMIWDDEGQPLQVIPLSTNVVGIARRP